MVLTEGHKGKAEPPAKDSSNTAEIINLDRTASTDVEKILVKALRSALWKTPKGEFQSNDLTEIAYGTAVEIERRLKTANKLSEIEIKNGTVEPVEGLEEELKESPLVQEGEVDIPKWATETVKHTWIEVNIIGDAQQYLVDPHTPRQITAQPVKKPRIFTKEGVKEFPKEYTADESMSSHLCGSQYNSVDTPWNRTTHSWPFGTPLGVSQTPADGGEKVVKANSVINIDVREGLSQIPSNSVDVIITSPPYRLQRVYSEAESLWDASPNCDHNWETDIVRTETTISDSGGRGFGGRTKQEVDDERHRTSTKCKKCGGWYGQLGCEVELDDYLDHLTSIFSQCRRILKDEGSLFINIGDSFDSQQSIVTATGQNIQKRDAPKKSMVGVPERLMVNMIDEGWTAREHYVWTKPDVAPDPAQDRASKSYEHVFRFVLQPDYHDTGEGPDYNVLNVSTSDKAAPTAPMPKEIPEKLLQGAAPKEKTATVVDPFAGSGTVLKEAAKQDHDYIGFEINPEAVDFARNQLREFDRETKSIGGGQISMNSFDIDEDAVTEVQYHLEKRDTETVTESTQEQTGINNFC